MTCPVETKGEAAVPREKPARNRRLRKWKLRWMKWPFQRKTSRQWKKRKNSKALLPRQQLGRPEKKIMGLAAGPAVVPVMEMAVEREMDPAAGPVPAMEAVAAVQPIRML